MKKKTYQSKVLAIAGIVSVGVILAFVGVSSSLTGQVAPQGKDPGGSSSNMQKPDLSVIKNATDSVAWDGTYTVNYSVTNRGGKATQAYLLEPYFTGAYDEVKRVFVNIPISYNGMKTADGIAPNRVGCGTGGGNLRCIFARGINAGETLEFSVFYFVNKAPVQCDRVLQMASATIAPGLNLNPFALQSSLRNDANPADNVSESHTIQIDCTSITGDLQSEVSGPETLARNAIGEYTVTLRNVGPVLSSTVPVQVTVPSSGFDIVKAEGKERGGMCVKTNKDSSNQITCVNPSVQLTPGQAVTYKIRLRAKTQECTSGVLKVEISKSLKRPTPKFQEIYETNEENNLMSLQISCDPNSDISVDQTQPQPNPWGSTGAGSAGTPGTSPTTSQPKINSWGSYQQ